MSDSQTPQDDPVPDQVHVVSASPPSEPQRRTVMWAAVAAVCVALGVLGSVIAARTVARNDTTSARQASQQASAAVASNVKLAIQREDDLRISGSTFFAGDSKATPAEFDRWAHWARTLRRYPELEQLGLVTLVHGSELATFGTRAGARAGGKATKPATAPATKPATPALKITPAGERPFYCLAIAGLARHPAQSPPAGQDYCAAGTGLLLARDSGNTRVAVVSTAGTTGLEMMTPVYKGDQPPATLDKRMGAFAGWLREVFVPSVVLEAALQSHPADAVRLSYASGSASVVYNGGTMQPGVPSTTIDLHDGWTVQGFGTPVTAGTLNDGNALALLIVGCTLSALLGLLVLVLGDGRPVAPVPAPKTPKAKPPAAPVAPAEDLHDALTGLPNRALMLDRAECMLARAGRQSGLLVGALFIDIDWFGDVNERLGQGAGDQILKIVAERLEGVVRAGDTVGRLGGDEFVLLVESAARGARLDNLARRVVEALHKPFELEGFEPNFFLTASIGVAFGRYATPEDLLRDAQLALHAAKSAGKDRYTLFNANMRSVIEGRGDLEVELNAALTDKQFFLLYEPIYDLASGEVAGLEALIRWLHPKQGVMLPADFIPLAEETGLTVPIGRWALEEACGRAAAWNVAGHNVGVSVEVTANQLNRENFVTDVRRALQQSGIEPSLLTLEIAETTVMSDVTAAVQRLEEIKALGVRVAIDDFGGSGYAYHSDLRLLPLDFLKVDRGSLAASEDEDYRTWLLEAILIVGRDLSLTVIAKGIDSHEQLSSLQAMGCTMAQGTLMGKAVPANALENVFEATLPQTQPAEQPQTQPAEQPAE